MLRNIFELALVSYIPIPAAMGLTPPLMKGSNWPFQLGATDGNRAKAASGDRQKRPEADFRLRPW